MTRGWRKWSGSSPACVGLIPPSPSASSSLPAILNRRRRRRRRRFHPFVAARSLITAALRQPRPIRSSGIPGLGGGRREKGGGSESRDERARIYYERPSGKRFFP